jgi:hypothetical protein
MGRAMSRAACVTHGVVCDRVWCGVVWAAGREAGDGQDNVEGSLVWGGVCGRERARRGEGRREAGRLGGMEAWRQGGVSGVVWGRVCGRERARGEGVRRTQRGCGKLNSGVLTEHTTGAAELVQRTLHVRTQQVVPRLSLCMHVPAWLRMHARCLQDACHSACACQHGCDACRTHRPHCLLMPARLRFLQDAPSTQSSARVPWLQSRGLTAWAGFPPAPCWALLLHVLL